jgi:hypothetical protein
MVFIKKPPSPLRLTSHIFVLSALIVVTLGAVGVAGLQTFVAPCILPLAIAALFVPFADLLNAVDDTRERLAATPAHALQPLVSRLCQELRIQPPAQIVETHKRIGLHTVGGLRRSMIAGPAHLLDRLAMAYLDPASDKRTLVEAIFFHELQHVAQKDVRWLAWTRSLLGTVALASGWVFVLALGLLVTLQTLALPFLGQMLQPDMPARFAQATGLTPDAFAMLFPSDSIQDALNQGRAVEYGWLYLGLTYTLLPFAITCGVLAAGVWRRMVRVREFYADAAVAERYGADVARRSLNYLRTLSAFSGAAHADSPARNRRRFNLPAGFSALVRYHPSAEERSQALANLAEVLTRPRDNGMLIGGVALLLSVLSSGAASVIWFGAQPALLPLLVIFAATSILMTPAVMALPQQVSLRRILACAGLALLIGALYDVLNSLLTVLMAMIQPSFLRLAVDQILRTVYGLQQSVVQLDDVPMLMMASAALLIMLAVGAGLVLLALWIDVHIKRRFVDATHVNRLALLSTAGVGACLALALIALNAAVKFLLR